MNNFLHHATDVTVLDRGQCEALLAAHSVGRVAFASGHYPVILPVNYTFSEGLVSFRTDVGEKLEHVPLSAVAFEIDGRDESSWWSVLVQGDAREVTTALGPRYERLRATEIAVVAPGPKTHWIAIEIANISGRSFSGTGRRAPRSRRGS